MSIHGPSRNPMERLHTLVHADPNAEGTKHLWDRNVRQIRTNLLEMSGAAQHKGFYEETYTEHGIAISPDDATDCMIEQHRLTSFSLGLLQAVQEMQRRRPGETIKILYAGTGPFATLLLPIIPDFSAGDIEVTAIDIHQASVESAEQLMVHLGVRSFFKTFIQADATRFIPSESFHVLVTETMDRTLTGEPQAAITVNLTKYLTPDGILVPESVAVNLVALNLVKCYANDEYITRKHLGNVIRLTKESTEASLDIDSTHPVGDNVSSDCVGLVLETRIRTFGALHLGPEQSGNLIVRDTSIVNIYEAPQGRIHLLDAVRIQYRTGDPSEDIKITTIEGSPKDRNA